MKPLSPATISHSGFVKPDRFPNVSIADQTEGLVPNGSSF